jgi:SOS-response transcriptional repressor LexA
LENFAKELKKIRLSSGKSQAEFAKTLGVSQRTWSAYESGETRPKVAMILALESKGFSIRGLLPNPIQDAIDAGKISQEEITERRRIADEMAKNSDPETPIDDNWGKAVSEAYNRLKTSKLSHLGEVPIYSSADMADDRKAFVIPLLDQRLSAGNGQMLPEKDDVTALVPVPPYLSKYGKNLAALTVEGDSMYPTLSRGDMVVCDSCGWSGEGVYALRMGGEGFVKRITKEPGKVVVLSDNPKYPPREVSEDSQDFELIGRVHCAIKQVE